MGKSPQKSVTKVTGETWEVENLYVGDASLFMTASGVDPMLTVETLAYGVARNIISRLGKNSW
jgi:choline dehydrogenase-like flavoprotein